MRQNGLMKQILVISWASELVEARGCPFIDFQRPLGICGFSKFVSLHVS